MSLKESIDPGKIPAHVAVIMDGNGRWARQKGFIRIRGHEKGVDAVRETVEAATGLGVKFLTLYAFSTENWNRPKHEVDALMKILVRTIHKERKTFAENNIRLRAVGDLRSLPPKSQKELENAIAETSGNTGLTLILAISYSARWEITEGMRSIARDIRAGLLQPESVSAELISSRLTTAGVTDPELLIRTSGEYRISNFLLWQIAYAELYFTPTLWPDFNREEFYKAILDYQQRERRFGMTSDQIKKQKRNLPPASK
jgi:undecaprenyl diphosphate synthase